MPEQVRVSLFVTCLVDQFFPEVGESMVRVLRRLGVSVEFPQAQTCCGQPAFNTGYRREARALAERFLEVFAGSQYVVTPSGSCAAMVKVFYPELLRGQPALYRRAQELAARTFEFSQFLVRVLGVTQVGASFPGKVTYHDACHLLRELGVSQEPRALLQAVRGLELVELEQADVCCGFGGTFAIKFHRISEGILEEKLQRVVATGAEVLVACDSGCLMHIGGALARRGLPVRTMHLAQVLDTGG